VNARGNPTVCGPRLTRSTMLTTPNCREACRSGKEASGVRSDIHATKGAFRTTKGRFRTSKETLAKTSFAMGIRTRLPCSRDTSIAYRVSF
jgi:hypothetical protein